jgi:hypothetical protein
MTTAMRLKAVVALESASTTVYEPRPFMNPFRSLV